MYTVFELKVWTVHISSTEITACIDATTDSIMNQIDLTDKEIAFHRN